MSEFKPSGFVHTSDGANRAIGQGREAQRGQAGGMDEEKDGADREVAHVQQWCGKQRSQQASVLLGSVCPAPSPREHRRDHVAISKITSAAFSVSLPSAVSIPAKTNRYLEV